jgi:hypothetical protein
LTQAQALLAHLFNQPIYRSIEHLIHLLLMRSPQKVSQSISLSFPSDALAGQRSAHRLANLSTTST